VQQQQIRWLVRIGFGAAIGFVILSVAVRLDLLNSWDTSTRYWFRPNDEWGPRQLRADHVVEGLRPTRILPLLAILVVIVCVVRRSIRPAVLAGFTVFLAAVLTVVSKVAVARPDTHNEISDYGGSFPSGHMVTIMVCGGLLTLLFRPRLDWGLWLLPAVAGAVMGLCLLLQAAHWTSDVLGGVLLAVVILAAAGAVSVSARLTSVPNG
jgi:hypothetical protein